MTESPVVHSTFVIEREYAAPASRVFAAFADPASKKRWFFRGKGFEGGEFSADFRVGGYERSSFRFVAELPGAPPAGTPMGNHTVYLDIIPSSRIVFAYTMIVAERRMSVSLATVQLTPSGAGTRLVFTEQAAFFDPADGVHLREAGWREILSRLDAELRSSR